MGGGSADLRLLGLGALRTPARRLPLGDGVGRSMSREHQRSSVDGSMLCLHRSELATLAPDHWGETTALVQSGGLGEQVRVLGYPPWAFPCSQPVPRGKKVLPRYWCSFVWGSIAIDHVLLLPH